MTALGTATIARVCADCGIPPDCQGLTRLRCRPCYRRHQKRGTHMDLPRPSLSRADVVDDYLLLRAEGYSRSQIAERLGMTRNTLDVALKRAALAGDNRIDYQPRRAA